MDQIYIKFLHTSARGLEHRNEHALSILRRQDGYLLNGQGKRSDFHPEQYRTVYYESQLSRCEKPKKILLIIDLSSWVYTRINWIC
jgi:hypothetical protein